MAEKKTWKKLWEDRVSKFKDFDPIKLNGFYGSFADLTQQMIGQIVDLIKLKLKLSKSDNLLEVGCGAGMLLIPLSKYVKHFWGADYSEPHIKAMKKHFNVNALVAKADKLPFNDNEFNKILCHSVFQYFPSLNYAKKSISEMIRVCGHGGRILIMDIPDLAKKKACDDYRMSLNPEKASKDNLWHLFYPRSFFKEICKKNNLKHKIWNCNINGYNNSKFRFNILIERD